MQLEYYGTLFFELRKGTWAVMYVSGGDMNVHHLQAQVSHLLSHVTEHITPKFGLVGARQLPRGSP